MPCWTTVTVEIKNLEIAKMAMEALKQGSLIYREVGNKYEVELPTSVSKAEFKTEYGLRIVEKKVRAKFGLRAQITRTRNEKNQPMMVVKY